jgi:hypothetical protein
MCNVLLIYELARIFKVFKTHARTHTNTHTHNTLSHTYTHTVAHSWLRVDLQLTPEEVNLRRQQGKVSGNDEKISKHEKWNVHRHKKKMWKERSPLNTNFYNLCVMSSAWLTFEKSAHPVLIEAARRDAEEWARQVWVSALPCFSSAYILHTGLVSAPACFSSA